MTRRGGHHSCTCTALPSDPKYDKFRTNREDCLYHQQAAMYPSDHSIPWNCPTYYDGCNCRETVRDLREKLAKAETRLLHFQPDQPIHPVAIKPSSRIGSWDGWPEDVRDTLWGWNHKGGDHALSFRENAVFKCPGCEQFCRQHNGAVLDGVPVCDDCLIGRARSTQPQLVAA